MGAEAVSRLVGFGIAHRTTIAGSTEGRRLRPAPFTLLR
jgi:hypothetical protein